MAWLSQGGFFPSLKTPKYLVSGLNNLSASNEIGIHLRGSLDEHYSSVPRFPFFQFQFVETSSQL